MLTLRHNYYSLGVLVKRDFTNLVHNPLVLSYNAFFPLLLILTLGYLTKGLYGTTVTSYDYYSITLLIFASLNVSITAGNSFMENSIKATNLRVAYAPIPPAQIYLSKIIASFLFTSIFTFLHILLLQAFGVNLGGKLAWHFALLLTLFNLFSASLGVFFCCIFKSEELANSLLSFLNNILAVVGGLFFTWDGLGKTAEIIARLSPVKWVVTAAMRLIYDQSFTAFYVAVLILSLSIPFLFLGCRVLFRTEDYV